MESEDAAFLKDTFAALVQGLTTIDPRTIQADATYVVPGNEDDGLSEDDLLDPGWKPSAHFALEGVCECRTTQDLPSRQAVLIPGSPVYS